jgi:hypothetical protein
LKTKNQSINHFRFSQIIIKEMSIPLSVRIPAGKLGTVRVDRTVDVYPTSLINDENILNAKTCISTLVLQRQLTAIPKPLIIENPLDERSYIPITRWNDLNDDDRSDIAVIYSVVRRATTRRTSSPRLSVFPLSTNFHIPQAHIAKSYILEPPLVPMVTHISKEAQIKTLSTTTTTQTNTISLSNSSQLTPPTIRIQASTSFTSHDRPSLPLITIKPRPYSFRSTGRSVLERRISNITERVSQLHETFFSRLSNSPNQQRNRSLSTFNSTNTHINESNTLNIRVIRPRPKSENYDDHHRINTGKVIR